MSVTIGGIKYSIPGAPDSPPAGGYNGFCCEVCQQEAIEACRNGYATGIATAEYPVSVANGRIAALSVLHMRRAVAINPKVLKWLLNGSAAFRIDLDLLSLSQENAPGSDDQSASYAATYACIYAVYEVMSRSSDNSSALMWAQRAKERFAAASTYSYACGDCEEVRSGEPMLRAALPQTSEVFQICPDCASNNWTYSTPERRWLRTGSSYGVNEEVVYPEFLDGPVTQAFADANYFWNDESDEWEQERPPAARLLSYSADPFSHFGWDIRNADNALVFGVELEMEPLTNNTGRTLIEALGGSVGGNYILKSDGSLSDGVELVTMPFTLEQHKDNSGVDWEKALSSVAGKAKSGVGTTACGIHIHINKRALSALTIGKMLVFLNSESLSPLITTIAQRASSQYCTRDSGKKIIDGIKNSRNRYDIMNISAQHPTCEIRMFRGNLRRERVLKNIEFCHAMVQYCRQTSLQDLNDWGNFTRWLIKHRGVYSYLVQFLIDKQAVGFRQLTKLRQDGTVAICDL